MKIYITFPQSWFQLLSSLATCTLQANNLLFKFECAKPLVWLLISAGQTFKLSFADILLTWLVYFIVIPITFVTDKGSETGILYASQTALR